MLHDRAAVRIGSSIGFSIGQRIGGLRGSISPIGSWDASTSTLAQLAALATHSRTSLATMFDSTGKLTYAPNNLLTQSNTFSNAAWTKSTMTVTSGVTDPLGGTNAFTLTATGPTSYIYQSVTGNASTTYMNTLWMKRRTGSGTVRLDKPDGATANAVTLTGSWQQFYVTGPGAAANAFQQILIATSGDAVDIYFGTLSAVTYETTPRTADQVITTASAYYGPRIDYDPNTLAVKGLLIEEARTNLALQSQNFTNAAWTLSSATVSSPSATAPDGTATAQKLVENAGTVNPQVFNTSVFTVTNGANYSWTVFFKAAERSWGVVNAYDSAVHRTYFNLNTGTIGTNAAGNTASIQAVGNGWYRCQVSRAITGTSAYAQFEISSADNTPTYTGDGTSGVYIWGAQFDAGSFATSYIPDAAAAVTRAADALAAALYSSNPSILQVRNLSTGVRSRKKLTTFSSVSSELNEWIEAFRVYPVGTSSAYLDAHLTVDGSW